MILDRVAPCPCWTRRGFLGFSLKRLKKKCRNNPTDSAVHFFFFFFTFCALNDCTTYCSVSRICATFGLNIREASAWEGENATLEPVKNYCCKVLPEPSALLYYVGGRENVCEALILNQTCCWGCPPAPPLATPSGSYGSSRSPCGEVLL